MEGKKQSLNLTDYAWYILRCDYSAFTNENSTSKNIGAKYLCKIFLKYYRQADASIGIKLRDREIEIRKMLGKNSDELCDIFIKAEKKKISEFTLKSFAEIVRRQSSPHTVYIPESVQCEIRDYAFGSEAYYYSTYRNPQNHYMKYFRAVLEEYIRLPYCRREAVFFGDTVKAVNDAIRHGCSVSFVYGAENVYGYPVSIEPDEWSSFNYLLLVNPQMEVKHYRICRIKSISPIYTDTIALSAEKRSEIYEKQIIPAGIQFAGEPLVDVAVKLSEKGMEMYNRMVFLRPRYTSIKALPDEGYLCNFCCSANQIKFYFFKFGEDAQIVSPVELKEYFLENYRKAYNLYKGKRQK